MSPEGLVVTVFEPRSLGVIRDLVVLLGNREMRHVGAGAPGPELGNIYLQISGLV